MRRIYERAGKCNFAVGAAVCWNVGVLCHLFIVFNYKTAAPSFCHVYLAARGCCRALVNRHLSWAVSGSPGHRLAQIACEAAAQLNNKKTRVNNSRKSAEISYYAGGAGWAHTLAHCSWLVHIVALHNEALCAGALHRHVH